jgi:hypothetical protein
MQGERCVDKCVIPFVAGGDDDDDDDNVCFLRCDKINYDFEANKVCGDMCVYDKWINECVSECSTDADANERGVCEILCHLREPNSSLPQICGTYPCFYKDGKCEYSCGIFENVNKNGSCFLKLCEERKPVLTEVLICGPPPCYDLNDNCVKRCEGSLDPDEHGICPPPPLVKTKKKIEIIIVVVVVCFAVLVVITITVICVLNIFRKHKITKERRYGEDISMEYNLDVCYVYMCIFMLFLYLYTYVYINEYILLTL